MKQGGSSKKHSSELTRICYILISELNSNRDDHIQHPYIKLDDISKRFNLKENDAKRVLSIISLLATSDYAPIIPFADNYNTPYLQLSSYVEYEGHPTRLNYNESLALLYALKQAGFNEDKVISKLDTLLILDKDSREDIVKQLASMQNDRLSETLTKCSVSCVSKTRISFDYQSNSDMSPRLRTVDPLYVYFKDEYWYLSAWDISSDLQKTYKVDKIENLKLVGKQDKHNNIQYVDDFSFKNDELVELTFTDTTYLKSLDWYGLDIVNSTDTQVKGVIPWSGSMWLPKQIAATANTVTANNKQVMDLSESWKKQQLETYLNLFKN